MFYYCFMGPIFKSLVVVFFTVDAYVPVENNLHMVAELGL